MSDGGIRAWSLGPLAWERASAMATVAATGSGTCANPVGDSGSALAYAEVTAAPASGTSSASAGAPFAIALKVASAALAKRS